MLRCVPCKAASPTCRYLLVRFAYLQSLRIIYLRLCTAHTSHLSMAPGFVPSGYSTPYVSSPNPLQSSPKQSPTPPGPAATKAPKKQSSPAVVPHDAEINIPLGWSELPAGVLRTFITKFPANIYNAASTAARIVGSVPRGAEVTETLQCSLLPLSDEWRHVRHGGVLGCIQMAALTYECFVSGMKAHPILPTDYQVLLQERQSQSLHHPCVCFKPSSYLRLHCQLGELSTLRIRV